MLRYQSNLFEITSLLGLARCAWMTLTRVSSKLKFLVTCQQPSWHICMFVCLLGVAVFMEQVSFPKQQFSMTILISKLSSVMFLDTVDHSVSTVYDFRRSLLRINGCIFAWRPSSFNVRFTLNASYADVTDGVSTFRLRSFWSHTFQCMSSIEIGHYDFVVGPVRTFSRPAPIFCYFGCHQYGAWLVTKSTSLIQVVNINN